MKILMNRMLIGIALSSLLVSCGGGSSDNESAYNGTWKELPECDYDASTGNGDTYTLDISGNDFTVDSKRYSTSDCSGTSTRERVLNYRVTYGADIPNASSICSNTREADFALTGGVLNGVVQTVDELKARGVDEEAYDLICSSNNRLYFGDTSEQATDGTTRERRPVLIDDEGFLILN